MIGVRGSDADSITASADEAGDKRENTIPNTKPTFSSSSVGGNEKKSEKQKEARLSGYDFRSWEKFDVDEAVAKIDEDEVEEAKKIHRNTKRTEEIGKSQAAARRELHIKEMEKLRHELSMNAMSDTEKLLRAVREKEKGGVQYQCAHTYTHTLPTQKYSFIYPLQAMNVSRPSSCRALCGITLRVYVWTQTTPSCTAIAR